MKNDIQIKRAKFIDRNNTLRQEFHFADPDILIRLNQIYNSDYSGSPVWDLFCHEQEMLENSFSISIRLMLGLPRETHRYLLEPLSGNYHMKTDLIKRFINFIGKIRKTKKTTLHYVLDVISNDVRSVTGKNLHKIKIRSGLETVEEISSVNCIVPFRKIPDMIKELICFRNNGLDINGFEYEEIESILTWICTSGPS